MQVVRIRPTPENGKYAKANNNLASEISLSHIKAVEALSIPLQRSSEMGEGLKTEVEQLIQLPYQEKLLSRMVRLADIVNLQQLITSEFSKGNRTLTDGAIVEVARKLKIEKLKAAAQLHDLQLKDKFAFVLSGTVRLFFHMLPASDTRSQDETKLVQPVTLKDGDTIGKYNLYDCFLEFPVSHIRALTDTTLITLRKKDFVRCFSAEFADKSEEIMQFLRSIPNLAHISKPHLRVLGAGLTETHYKPEETVMEQGRSCERLFILKHGRVVLLRIVRKDSVSIDEFSEVFHKVYEHLPDEIEIEVNIKHTPGDLLLLPEIIKSVPSKYKIKALIPTCICSCDVEYIYKHVGIDKFLDIPDAEYLGTSDKLFLKHHIEKLGWDKCRSSIVQEKVVENMRRDFYIGSKNRYMNKIPPMRPAPIQKLVDHYLKSKLQFFSDQGVNRVKSLNPSVDKDSESMPESVKLLYPSKTTASDQRQKALTRMGNTLFKVRSESSKMQTSKAEEDSELDQEEDQTSALVKYQCKHIVQRAYNQWLDKQKADVESGQRQKPALCKRRSSDLPLEQELPISNLSTLEPRPHSQHKSKRKVQFSASLAIRRRSGGQDTSAILPEERNSLLDKTEVNDNFGIAPTREPIVVFAPYQVGPPPGLKRKLAFLPSVNIRSKEAGQASKYSLKPDVSFSSNHQIHAAKQQRQVSVHHFQLSVADQMLLVGKRDGTTKPRSRSFTAFSPSDDH